MIWRACATFLLLLLPSQTAGGQSACEDWNTPAFFQSASLDTLQRCLAAGAVPTAVAEDGWTPLHHAAQFADALDVFAMLVAAGADPDAVGDDVASPLAIAAGNDRPAEVIAALARIPTLGATTGGQRFTMPQAMRAHPTWSPLSLRQAQTPTPTTADGRRSMSQPRAAHFVRYKRLEERLRECAAPPVRSVEPE